MKKDLFFFHLTYYKHKIILERLQECLSSQNPPYQSTNYIHDFNTFFLEKVVFYNELFATKTFEIHSITKPILAIVNNNMQKLSLKQILNYLYGVEFNQFIQNIKRVDPNNSFLLLPTDLQSNCFEIMKNCIKIYCSQFTQDTEYIYGFKMYYSNSINKLETIYNQYHQFNKKYKDLRIKSFLFNLKDLFNDFEITDNEKINFIKNYISTRSLIVQDESNKNIFHSCSFDNINLNNNLFIICNIAPINKLKYKVYISCFHSTNVLKYTLSPNIVFIDYEVTDFRQETEKYFYLTNNQNEVEEAWEDLLNFAKTTINKNYVKKSKVKPELKPIGSPSYEVYINNLKLLRLCSKHKLTGEILTNYVIQKYFAKRENYVNLNLDKIKK